MDGSQLISDETERPTADVDVSQDVIARGVSPARHREAHRRQRRGPDASIAHEQLEES